MYNKLKDMYIRGLLDETKLDNAIKKGWITPEQKQEILNSK